jgi:hypothetical protein
MKPIRKPMRFFHMLLPHVKDVKLNGDDDNEIVGRFDFSEAYDPFDLYEEDARTAPHMVLTELEDDPYAALQFTRKWGPLRLSEVDVMDDATSIELYARSISHATYPRRRESVRGPITFTTSVRRFSYYRSEVRELMHLWVGFRDGNLKNLRDLLQARITPPVPEYEDEPPDEYDDYLYQRQLITSALSTRRRDPVMNVTAWLINDHFSRHTTYLWLRPCFEILTNTDDDNARPSGFRMGLHLENLIDAIYMMVWHDISGSNIGKICPNCHRLFIPTRPNACYCSAGCRDKANSKRHYERSKDKQTR